MNFKLKITFGVFLMLIAALLAKADFPKQDEMLLRKQLFENVDTIKNEVNDLKTSVDVLNKRYNTQMDVLKSIQTKFLIDSNEDDDSVCEHIVGMFNSTFRKYNAFEKRIMTKLDEVQDEQTTLLEEFLLKQKTHKNCPKSDSNVNLSPIANTLAELSEKVEKFDGKFKKLDLLEQQFMAQKSDFDKFVEQQLKLLQEINGKLSKNQEKFDKFGQELTSLKELKTKINQEVPIKRRKLPMEVLLGITSSSKTTLK